MYTYEILDEYLKRGRNPDDRPAPETPNNTRVARSDGGNIGIVLHGTEIVTFYPDGRIVLNAGGWRTRHRTG